MADDRYRQDYRQQSQDDRYPQQHPQGAQQQPQYPPPPGDARDRDAPRPHDDHRSSMAASVSLPAMHDPRAPGYGPSPHGQNHAYPTDPRYAASPSATNGYPPPPGQQPGPGGYLPPLQQSDPRAAGYRPPEHQYNAGARPPPPGYPQDPQYQHPDPYYYRQQPQPPQGPPNAYPYPQGPYPPDYGQQGGPQMAQAAPRQRTSIACKYCRKRKIRCSGYQSAPGGKCQNCARMNQECVFQPVSSSSSTAFIPVSAVPGGVPPGTPLYGAYGQPLAPQAHPYPQGGPQQHPPGPYYQHHPQGPPPHQGPPGHHPQGPHMQQGPPAQSPSESSYSYTSASRTEEGSQAGRRRRRSSEDQDESYRLPPPRVGATEEEPRRRSPAEFSSRSSPGGLGLPPFSSRQSPRNPTLPQLANQNQAQPSHDGRSPAQPNVSSGGSTPARQGQPANQTPTHQPAQQAGQQQQSQGQQSGKQSSSVMNLSNLMDSNTTNIDRGMLDRLNKPKDTKPSK